MQRTRTEVNAMAALVLRGADDGERVVLAWPLVSGARVADRTHAASFADGVLTVEVPDAAWRNELAGYMPQYMHQLRGATQVEIREIKFVVNRNLGTSA